MTKEKHSLDLLVIEDNQGDLLLIEDLLHEKIRFPTIQEATCFKDVKRLFEESEPDFDAILLDLTLPDNSGEALLRDVMALAKSTPVIVLTGYSDIDFGIKSLSMGISDYLLKEELTATSLYKSIIYSIERKEIYNNLRESEKRYKDLFHFSPEPMWLYDIETLEFLDINDAAIKHYGFSREEFLSMSVLEIEPPEQRKLFEQNHGSKNGEEQSIAKGIFNHIKKNGETIKVDLQSNILQFEGKKAVIVLAKDVTDRLNYISEIEEKNMRLQEIAWIQSHVVRAPLARLMGLVYAVNDPATSKVLVSEDEEQQKFYNLILKSAHELDGIIRNIADKADKIKFTNME